MAQLEQHQARATVDEPAVIAEDVHVTYRVFEDRRLSLAELAGRGFRGRSSSEVTAVNGVSFRIAVGEAVGLIGPNGSGKSTLLRCVAGVQHMTRGRILVRGHAQLLAVNAALDAKLSGRRNIYLGGLAMGLRLDDIESRVDQVIQFCELDSAIDRPMRTYSSGMRARLAFSIATMAKPPVLLIDEALAVGDRSFRRKSLERLRELQADAGTLMMVTHNLNEIRTTCTRVLWLDRGTLVMDGPTDEVIDAYDRD